MTYLPACGYVEEHPHQELLGVIDLDVPAAGGVRFAAVHDLRVAGFVGHALKGDGGLEEIAGQAVEGVAVAFGVGDLPRNGNEAVAQKWVAVVDDERGFAVTCINAGTYGSDFSDDGLRLNLLRSPGYSCHPWPSRSSRRGGVARPSRWRS
jgi:hypothetical protein